MTTKPVSIRLEPETIKRIDKLAKADSRTRSNYLELIIRKILDAEERKGQGK